MAYPLAEQKALQKQNISSEPVHSRINELMALHEFMADANIKRFNLLRKEVEAFDGVTGLSLKDSKYT